METTVEYYRRNKIAKLYQVKEFNDDVDDFNRFENF